MKKEHLNTSLNFLKSMKHTVKITVILVALFLLAQFIGLAITNEYLTRELPYDIERPKFEGRTAPLQVFSIIIIATFLAILLARFKVAILWKLWFFFAVWFCLMIALAVLIGQGFALVIAFLLTIFKVLRPNIIIHNLTELFIYGGLAAIFVPVFSLKVISILLVIISIYDMIAVWKTKHMIKLAKFQAKLRLFAGLLVPYVIGKIGRGKKQRLKVRTAVLGGGDIGFPLLFAGVVMKTAGVKALIIPWFAALALVLLLLKGKKKRFYPAMPFLTAGCFLGYLVLLLI